MKIVINKENLELNEKWQIFHKVRAIVENDKNEFIISNEGGKCIFPGGKRDKNETNIQAIQRELKEETGISLDAGDFTEILELETLYPDFYDYRSDSIKPRFTSTIYYYVKCQENINFDNMDLTDGEIQENFKVAFVSKEKLIELLLQDHSFAVNGKFFDEENQIVVENILKKLIFNNCNSLKK